jgi:ADP-heptose:LPS heptosyltransferase
VISFKAALQQLRQLPPAYDLLIHPGAGSDNRKWPWLHYAELLKNLPTRYRIAVLGLPEDVAAMRAVLSDDPRVEFLTGNFEQALAAIARARIALTMDSGTMFFAKALGVPAVSLFGPSNPGNVIAQGGTITPLYEQKWPCQPCQNLRCRQDALYCMDSISPHRVAQTLLRLLHSAA